MSPRFAFDDLSPEQQAAVERQRAQGATHVPAPAPASTLRELGAEVDRMASLVRGPVYAAPSRPCMECDPIAADCWDGDELCSCVCHGRAAPIPPPPRGDERAAREARGLPPPAPAALPALPAPPPSTDALVTVGIDPGLSGALACVVGSRVLRLERTPTRALPDGGRDYDLRAMARLLFSLPRVDLVVIEKQQAYPDAPTCPRCACVPCRSRAGRGRGGQGTVSAFTTGRGMGLWEMALEAAELPWRAAGVLSWKKALGVLPPSEPRRKKGERPREETPEQRRARSEARRREAKRLAVERSRQLFPSARLVPPGCRRPHDGVAEALLLARFGRLIRANDGGR